MSENLITTKQLTNIVVFGGRKGKRIGKVRRFVFHPTEKRCIGLLVKRPDAALMFHRKDMFVALGGFDFDDNGAIVVHDDPDATDSGAVKALGVNWDDCVIWIGMPATTVSGELLGYIDAVTFNRETGAVRSLTIENGAAIDAILGKRVVPAAYIKGFTRDAGKLLPSAGANRDAERGEDAAGGAILVSDTALDLAVQGGAAAVAGKATAVVANKAKKGAVKAREGALVAKKAVDERLEDVKPDVQKFAEKAGEAVESGSFAVGKQIGKASGMFAAFKEEFDKAASGGNED